MDVDQFIAKLRIRLDDPVRVVPADQLWKTDELLDYTSEAINEFARVVEYWLDATTPEICEVRVIAGQRWVELDDRIIRIRRAKLDLAKFPFSAINSKNEDIAFPNWDASDNVGDPNMGMLGEEEGKMFFDRVPKVDDVLRLAVVRYPLCPIKSGDVMPIPDRYCLKMMPGVRSLAYKKQDADTFDSNKALSLEAEFQAELLKIKHEVKRRRHHPRQVVYREVG